MHNMPLKCICTYRNTRSADDQIGSATRGAEAINAHHRSSAMKTGIFGLGLTLSAAILAAPAGAADHADSSVLGTARAAASLSSTTRRAVNEFVDAYANRNSAGLAP